ncbi:MAG: RIP metalloprotease RseP [Verrucomicrobia bacterium]|nr:RIP metalloprotease RseP [Verrucomicrobiota bacterium]MBI3871255.1 RIP metalloprotease RseP [Verrucomicrobiota bacterium]
MDYLKPIFIGLEVLVLFNVLIFVHELGHFLAARWRGLKVERFAIWFGQPIWSRKFGDVEYALGYIPAGGYVSLPQMAPMEALEGATETKEILPAISTLDKIIVAFAGPLFSFLLAFVFAFTVWQVGRPVHESETTTIVGAVIKGGPAERAGLKPGDKLIEVDGKPVTKFIGMGSSVQWRVVRSEGTTLSILFERDGKRQSVEVTPTNAVTKVWQRKALRDIQIEPAQTPIIFNVVTNSPAQVAGLRQFDEIVSVNGRAVAHFAQVAEIVGEGGEKPVSMKVRRGTSEFTVQVTPERPVDPPDEKPKLGLEWTDGGRMQLAYPLPVEQIRASLNAMADTLEAVIAPKSTISVQQLGGAVKILSNYYLLFKTDQGWRLALYFSVLLNVNLAILNLLPFPVLDGGHITLALIESIRRKPVSLKVLQHVQSACAIVLIGFMLFLTFFDTQDLFHGRGGRGKPPQFSPKTAMPSSSAPAPVAH